MANIESIKAKILQLDAGSFQNLCDTYLCKKGYDNIVSLGGQAGTRKTTSGTPDTYFLNSNGNYIFVEYTTQQDNIYNKINEDIDKCLDVSTTEIPLDKIDEIIYCHTSSNLKPGNVEKLVQKCEEKNILLRFFNIDQIAYDLYLHYPVLAKDFLQLEITTGQIQEVEDFIKTYNSNQLAAPLDTSFLFREKDLEKIQEAFSKENVVILSGVAGVGKTRLALHFAKQYSAEHGMKLLCIHNNGASIYEELQYFLDKPGNYFLFVDDANQLSQLNYIVACTKQAPKDYFIQVLISVRSYAFQKVKRDIISIAKFEQIEISKFQDDEISKLVEMNFEITNPSYQKQLIRLAEGNARIALLAAKVAVKANSLSSIQDASEFYDAYYGQYLNQDSLFLDSGMYITAGIVSFLENIHLEHIDPICSILEEKGITKDVFIENLHLLHEQEIVDIYKDKAVKISEQCLSNYLVKLVFCDKKLISLSKMIKVCFFHFKSRTVQALNTLIAVFRNKETQQFIEEQINIVWDELKQESDTKFYEYVKVFFLINPTQTLLLLQEKIDSTTPTDISQEDLYGLQKNEANHIDNDILDILSGFVDCEDFLSALDLLFMYYLKRPDLYNQVRTVICQRFSINKDSNKYEYQSQIDLFNKFQEYLKKDTDYKIAILFFDCAKEFLKFTFRSSEAGRHNSFMLYDININLSPGVKKYRTLIWNSLLDLCEQQIYQKQILDVLNSYEGIQDEVSLPELQFDIEFIQSLMDKIAPTNELTNCLLAEQLSKIINTFQTDEADAIFSNYFETEDYKKYLILRGPLFDFRKADYAIRDEKHEEIVTEYISSHSLSDYKEIVDLMAKLSEETISHSWELSHGIYYFWDKLSETPESFILIVEYAMEKNAILQFRNNIILLKLFSCLSPEEILKIINAHDFSQKKQWIFDFYCLLPDPLVNDLYLQNFYSVLQNLDEKTFFFWSDISVIEKYTLIDPNAIHTIFTILLEKISSGKLNQHSLELIFNTNKDDSLIVQFQDDLELLSKFYFTLRKGNNNTCDASFSFFKKLYKKDKSVIHQLNDYIIESQNENRHHDEQYSFLFDFSEYNAIFDGIFENAINNCISCVSDILQHILIIDKSNTQRIERRDTWIQHCIEQFHGNMTMMSCLFEAIENLNLSNKDEYIKTFINYNNSFEDFKKIHLTPTSMSWSGSAVPLYSAQRDYLRSLLPLFPGIKWLEHKKYIEDRIENLNHRIEEEEIKDMLNG